MAMASLLYFVSVLLACTLVLGEEDSTVFNNDLHYVESETGGKLRLKSTGKLANIVDLDKVTSVKVSSVDPDQMANYSSSDVGSHLSQVYDIDGAVTKIRLKQIWRVLCRGHKILVALKKDEPDVHWTSGQLIIGSGQWGCVHNVLKPGSKTIYAKLEVVKRPKPYVVELHTTTAGPLDMFEDADINVHYEQGPMVPSRHRRYLSNPLRQVLNTVDWNASFTENIPFNQHGAKVDNVVNVIKQRNVTHAEINTGNSVTPDDNQLTFQCHDCRGFSQISYHFELKVNKVHNKAVIKKYIMQMEINTNIHHNYSLETDGELTLTKTGTPWRHLPSQVFQTAIASFTAFPPIMLTVNYSSQANMELKTMTKDKTKYAGEFTINGKTVISQRFEVGKPGENDVSVYNWTVVPGKQHLDTNATMNASYALYQNITIFPSISWAQKDVDMNLGPPIHVSTRPTLNVVSTSDTVARCAKSSLSVHSNVSVAETDFSVDAFNIHIWNVKLMNSLSRKLSLLQQQPLMEQCHADCHGPLQLHSDQQMTQVCGNPGKAITRWGPQFTSLHQLWGDYILFSSEESSSAWCGQTGTSCVNCTYHVIGDDTDRACADRMMSPLLASAATRLTKLVEAEWPNRKLIVQEAWDEPTSQYPHGRHGNSSLFYEGLAAMMMISQTSKTLEPETDQSVLDRLGELAVCSSFPYVKQENSVITACVEKTSTHTVRKRSLLSRKRRSGHVEHSDVKDMLEDLGNAMRESGAPSLPSVSSLTLHGSYPSGRSMEQACGDFTGDVSLDDLTRFRRLVEYPLDDIQFSREGPRESWCGVETRRCEDCSRVPGNLDDLWTWCGTRTMTMRLATRLQRLSVLTNGKVIVDKALSMNVSDGSSKLYKEGRAAKLRLKPGSSMSMADFTVKAIQAGFDYTRYSSSNTLEVCVKLQDGLQAHLAQFPTANLVSVPLPLGEEGEYDYPNEYMHESRKPLLFDASTSADNIGEHFKLHHFLSPGKRYVRLDPVLVNLLELAYEQFPGGFHVMQGSGYRPRSVNLDNFETRHPNEKHRYQMGQAFEIKPDTRVTVDSLFDLAMALIKVSRSVRTQRLGLGIGCKADRLYVELRPMLHETSQALDVWESGNSVLYTRLSEIETMIHNGGTVVSASSDPVVCKPPVLGSDYFYFNFDLDEDGYCWSNADDFCSTTHEHRYNISQVLQRRLTSAAGTGKLPRADIIHHIEECVINTCGGCPSAGTVWRRKVVACSQMVLKYLSRASVPFQPLKDKVSVFNTENHESGVHSQACHDDRICVENTQIYSLLMPLLTATYKKVNTDELLFGGGDNPSPLLEIVEQELAWRAEGKVAVFLESAKDVNTMRNVLKIIMAINRKVTDVTFHLDPDADEDEVITTLQRNTEQWSGSVCPQWSRLVITPYTMVTIPHERKRRSLERSKDRNRVKFNMKNWEVDWMLKS